MASTPPSPTCPICYDIYDQELAKAFTTPCGHSICAQCDFTIRLPCIKRGMPKRCWICMQRIEGPLYRTFALESTTPREETQRFENPYMTDNDIRIELTNNLHKYQDIFPYEHEFGQDMIVAGYNPLYRPFQVREEPEIVGTGTLQQRYMARAPSYIDCPAVASYINLLIDGPDDRSWLELVPISPSLRPQQPPNSNAPTDESSNQ